MSPHTGVPSSHTSIPSSIRFPEERYSKKVLFHASIAERKEPGAR